MTQSNKTFRRNLLYSIALFVTGAIFGGLVTLFAFITITGGTAEPSQPISAPTLAIPAAEPTEAIVADAPEPTQEIAPSTVQEEIVQVEEAAPEPTLEPTPEPTIEPSPTAEPTLAPQLFRINSEQSEARFSVYETFPEGTAVGRTNQIAGDIIVDFNTPANSQLGVIRVNLRSLVTDDPQRDQSVRCCVLLTAQDIYEFGEFAPTALSGLPETVELGQLYTFSVTGNLTIRGTTQQATFDVELLVNSLEELRGRAKTTVNRSDYNILNNAENGFDYHGVVEEVELEFDFVADAVVQN